MKLVNNSDISDYLTGLSDFQREIVLDIREIVLSSDPSIQEGIKWGSIAFYHKKNICGFRLAKNHVTLLFMEGALLNDKTNALGGSGSKARTLKIIDRKEIPEKVIKDLVRQALSIGM